MISKYRNIRIKHKSAIRRVLICGNSYADNPRDYTIVTGLKTLPGCRVIDCRFKMERWEHSLRGRIDFRKLLARVWKRTLRYKVKRLVLSRSVDCVLIMKINFSMLTLCSQWSKSVGIPTLYDLWVSRKLAAERDGLNTTEAFKEERKALGDADFPFATTEPYRQYYAETFFCDPHKIGVVPLAVTEDWLSLPKFNNSIEKPYVVSYWGNFLIHHGLDVFLEAAKELQTYKDIEFNIYGSKQGGGEKDILRTAGPNVRFFGRAANRRALIEAVDRSDVGVGHLLPIHDAHLMLPNKALEGMARSKPIIHIDHPLFYPHYGSPRAENRCLHYFKGRGRQLAGEILYLKRNPKIAFHIGNNARKKVEEYHSIDSVQKQLSLIIGKVRIHK